ncbi:MAG: DUF5703 domain-containing protein [Verrucomicrobiota bacterium]
MKKNKRMKILMGSLFVAVLGAGAVFAGNDPAWLAPYNVVWTDPCTKALDSMPIGGGNIALNVWTTDRELLFYIGSPDSWVDGTKMPQQVKVGRVRLTLSPNPFAGEFRQELDLASNSIRVSGKAADGTAVQLRIWVDTFKPVVHVEGEASKPVSATAAVEIQRGEGRFDGAAAVWCFRNEGASKGRLASIATDKIETIAASVPDPVGNLTCGGRLSGAGFIPGGAGEARNEWTRGRAWQIKTAAPVTKFDIRATLRIEQDSSMEVWEKGVARLESETLSTAGKDREDTAAWWKSFWDRSHIVINPGKSVSDPAWEVGRNYQLFRAMLAANRSGRMPTLFNGGSFICEADADARLWGWAGFTAQNQRLVYWPMLKTGDADLLRVGLDFYASRHGLAKAWAEHFWKIDGAVYTEDIDIFGLPVYYSHDGHTNPGCLRYHYTSGMEFALMMLETGLYTGEDIRRYVPIANGMLHFFDQFYRRQRKNSTGQELDKDGRLVLFPGSGLETYQGTTNDSATMAGLMALSDALLALPESQVSTADRAFWKEFRSRLAPIATRSCSGHPCISPAASWAHERPDFNMELPQLYPVFPFHIYGVGLPDLELARNTWLYGYTDAAKQKGHFCWYQGGIFTTCLGLTDEAREYVLARFLHPRWPEPGVKDGKPDRRKLNIWTPHWYDPAWKLPRYPAFWDCMGFCQRPDMDHGGAGMIQLQEMLMQTPGRQIILFPAWPKDWDVDFKLCAPEQTTVECRFKNGKVEKLVVTPASRQADVVDMSGVNPKSPKGE